MQNLEGNRCGSELSFCIIASRFNDTYVDRMLNGALKALAHAGVEQDNISVVRVPGALEIPLAAKQAALSAQYDAIVALGCVIRGKTTHFDNVLHNCSGQLMQISVEACIPITQAVLGVDSAEDALVRSSVRINRGREAAYAALEMANLMRKLCAS